MFRAGGLSVRKSQALLFLTDALLLVLSVLAAFSLRTSVSFSLHGLVRALDDFTGASLLVLLIYPTSLYVVGGYETEVDFRSVKVLAKVVLGILISIIGLSAAYYFFPNWRFGRATILWQSALFGVLATATRIAFSSWRAKYRKLRPVVFVGAGAGCRLVLKELTPRIPSAGLEVVLILDSRPELAGTQIEGVPVKSAACLAETVSCTSASMVVMCDQEGWDSDVLREALDCKVHGADVQELTDLYQRITGKVPVGIVGEQYFLFGPGFPASRNALQTNFWRLFDLAVATTGLLVTLPIQLLIALVILLVEGRPVFFTQQRLGLNERPFKLVKFRTMVRDAEKATGAVWASKDDPRVTRLGRFLRRTRLDELPQFWNVVKGEMSLIGPRPERPEFVAQLKKRIPFYSLRFSMPPGLTGWAQVNYRYGASETDAMEKLQYELYYVQKASLLINMMIILKTIQTVLFKPGS